MDPGMSCLVDGQVVNETSAGSRKDEAAETAPWTRSSEQAEGSGPARSAPWLSGESATTVSARLE